jgi:alkaline phosphatase D
MLVTRREFLAATASGVSLRDGGQPSGAPAIVTRERLRPTMPSGVQVGDIEGGEALVWSRTDRPARMMVEYATNDRFSGSRRGFGPNALEDSDFTARLLLTDLPPGQRIFCRVYFTGLEQSGGYSEPIVGSFRTPPAKPRDLRIVWGGDVVGQGWGINPEWGGLKIFETMRRLEPDLFIHSGDQIYADNPLVAEVKLETGQVWKNIVTDAKAKVAETLQDFRGNYAYNLLDAHLRRFNAEVPIVAQWDDHETMNNWFGAGEVDDPRYAVRRMALLSARARRAMFEYVPIRQSQAHPERIYRVCRYGPQLDIFVLDQRTYRGPNTSNRQMDPSPETAFLGDTQLAWLKESLVRSRATWKVIASDMPMGLVIRDRERSGVMTFEALANGDGPPLGRELEFASLLSFIKQRNIRNVVWITADVHYAAAHLYQPERAVFRDFLPFWEFVAGPLHAGTFGPGVLDDTFGPEVKFVGIPPGMRGNRPPTEGFQFFGALEIDGRRQTLTVKLYNLEGRVLYSQELES